ncbi:heavy-metal-associated domain-containing protein [Companilactobacillus insicii]|uniref:heavy-metal-associated domain-containing protein n=1 Tax=Companilactobacillus insicii TaxID=1732567 RepID=UPI000F781466|nr:heavy metal-associated domain-containing protein [Companilactobacillus insicii]
MEKQILVSGLHCENCPKHIAELIKDAKGVEKLDKDMDKMTLTISGNDDLDVNEIKADLASKPFKVEELA